MSAMSQTPRWATLGTSMYLVKKSALGTPMPCTVIPTLPRSACRVWNILTS